MHEAQLVSNRYTFLFCNSKRWKARNSTCGGLSIETQPVSVFWHELNVFAIELLAAIPSYHEIGGTQHVTFCSIGVTVLRKVLMSTYYNDALKFSAYLKHYSGSQYLFYFFVKVNWAAYYSACLHLMTERIRSQKKWGLEQVMCLWTTPILLPVTKSLLSKDYCASLFVCNDCDKLRDITKIHSTECYYRTMV